MRVLFVGDVMLGRFVREKHKSHPYNIICKDIQMIAGESDFVIANLESPITSQESNNSLAFAGDAALLDQLKWVNLFSLCNNHINDFGETGISETINSLNYVGIPFNGVFHKDYKPFTIDNPTALGGGRIAIVTCTDMLNKEFPDTCSYNVLRADSPRVNQVISEYSEQGYFTILFSHCGSLFSRYPNPQIRDLLFSAVDAGAKCVITCHSHCLGGVDIYKGVPIFYSLGDFLMDGGSYRRRKACILQLSVSDGDLKEWSIIPTITNKELQVVLPDESLKNKMIRDFKQVSSKMQKTRKDYPLFYKWQYKVEMLSHSLSTLHFLYDSKGPLGFLKMLKVRFSEVKRMLHRFVFDRSKIRYDADAVGSQLSNNDIK